MVNLKKTCIFFFLLFFLVNVSATTILVSDFNEGVGAVNSGSINLGQWEKQGTNGSTADDTNTQRFLTPGGIRLGSTNAQVAAMDKNGFQYDMNAFPWVKLRFQTDSNNTIDRIEMWFTDTNAATTNRVACFFGGVAFSMNKNIENGFTTFTAPVNSCTPVNSVNLQKVTRIRIRLLSSTGTDANVTFDSLSISDVNPFTQSKIVLGTIGGYSSTFTHFIPALDRNGFKSTNFIAMEEIGTTQHLTVSQLTSIYAKNHDLSPTDLNSINYSNLTTTERQTRISNMINSFDTNGFIKNSKRDFFWPQGKFDLTNVYDLNNQLRMGIWDANFGNYLENDFNTSYSKWGINSFLLDKGTSSQTVANNLVFCADRNLICVFLFGNITDNVVNSYDYNTADFNQLMGFITELDNNGRIDVLTLEQAFKPFPDFNLQSSTITPRVTQDVNFFAIINETDINFTFNSNFGFPDGNVNTSDNNIIFNDKFSDADYNIDPNWDAQTGNWQLTGGGLAGEGTNAYITNQFNSVMKGFGIHYDINSTTTFGNYVYLGTQSTQVDGVTGYPDDFNGYAIKLEPTSINVVSVRNETVIRTLISVAQTFNTSQGYSIDFNRDINGAISISVDGVIKGTSTDLNYTYFQGIGLSNATAAGIQKYDNFEVTNKLRPKFSTLRSFSNIGLNTACLTITSNFFIKSTQCLSLLTSGDINIQILDENTLLPVSDATVTINGTSVSQRTDGTIIFDMNSLLSTNIIVASSPTKSQRQWIFNSDFNTSIDYKLVLLETTKGSSIQFLMRDSNGNVFSDSNVIVNIRKPSSPAIDYNVFSGKTDSSGLITIFLNGIVSNDANYLFKLTSSSSSFNYDDSEITVNRPLDEDTNETVTNHSVLITGFGTYSETGLNTIRTYSVLSNTVTTYSFIIDGNSTYTDRGYGIQTYGGNSLTLQPFLVKVSDAATVTITVRNKNDPNETIPEVLILVKKSITGTGIVTLESEESDAAGQVTFSLIPNNQYILNFYYQTELQCSFDTPDPCAPTINTSQSAYDIYLNIDGIDQNNDLLVTGVIFLPSTGTVSSDDNGNINLTQIVGGQNIYQITVKVLNDTNVLYSNTITSVTAYTSSQTFTQIIDQDSLPSEYSTIQVLVITRGLDGNMTISHTYGVLKRHSPVFDPIGDGFRKLPQEWGTGTMVIVSILLTALILGAFNFVGFGSTFGIIVAGMILAVFTFVFGWFPQLAFYFACVIGFAGFLWSNKTG